MHRPTSLVAAAALLALPLSAPAAVADTPDLVRVANVLCETEDFALQYELERDAGQIQDMAIDVVGKRAGRAVCGFYEGRAAMAEQKVVAHDGAFYRLTAWRFVADGRVAWVAESTFMPAETKSTI